MTELNLHGIPLHMHDAVVRYVEHGIRPGSFLSAVFSNDFMGACNCADDVNRCCLFEYGRLLFSMPLGCHGSPDAVLEWIKQGGLRGLNGEAQ